MTENSTRRPVMNLDEAHYTDLSALSRKLGSQLPEGRYGGRMAQLGHLLGSRKLGYNVTVIAPGKRAFPSHCHRVNEEMFFVLEGAGEVRIGADVTPIRTGDFIACPPGGPETAHQLHNTGSGDLKVLAVSTMESPDICHYPVSGKFGVLADFGVDSAGARQAFRHIGRVTDARDYWEGE
ncbi:MAG: cupin domain-containing protein [Rhodanobacteraceae bacterium]